MTLRLAIYFTETLDELKALLMELPKFCLAFRYSLLKHHVLT